jgi:2-dehydropantoate 2-reductase
MSAIERVCVVGAGAVGGTVAARLAERGVGVCVVDASPEHVARLQSPGLVLESPEGARTVPLDARVAGPGALPPSERVELVLLAVRSDATETALAPLVGALAGDVVSLQNGLNEERIAGMVGAGRTIGCVVGFGATWIEPGHVALTAVGDLVIGRLDGTRDDRLEAARALLEIAFPTRIASDVTAALWAKLLVNSMTVLGALGGCLTGELLADPDGRVLARTVIAEGAAVALASGVRLRQVLGAVDVGLVANRGEGWESELDVALDLVAAGFGSVKSVTWRDLELGRPIEIDAVTGEVVRRGEALGVRVGASAAVYRTLREIESGRRRIARANLAELAATLRSAARVGERSVQP